MKISLVLSIALISSLLGRDNPFFSTEENNQLPISNNKAIHKPPMNTVAYHFPDHARVLKEVTFTFQNIDGSIETRRLEIDQGIDWHIPLTLSHVQHAKPATETSSANANFDFIRFATNQNRLVITTNDPLVRYFAQTDPNALVVDFQHKTPFISQSQILSAHPFSKVRVSNHGKFARATITLDGKYNCTITPSGNETIIQCK